MAEHASLAPSASARWIACPGSVRLSYGLPDVESEHAALGTFAHEVAAVCLRNGVDPRIGDTDLVHVVDEELADAVQIYLDAVRAVAGGGEHEIFVERKVRVSDDLWGTADAIVPVPRHENPDGELVGATLHVFDYKHGAGVFVPVENNTQLGCYALGALFGLPEFQPDFVAMHIIQPRHHLGGWSTQTVSVETLESWGDLGLRPAIEATKQLDAPLAAGDHCRFCPVKATCPELRREALDSAAHLFEHPDGDPHVYVADDKTGIVRAVKSPPPATDLTPDQVAAALSMFPTIEAWMKALREHAYTLANGGQTIPGHKLVDKQGHRKWVDPDAMELVAEVFDVDIYAPRKLASPAQIEKRLPKGQRGLVDRLAFKPHTGTTLVPDTDTRPALNAGDVFSDLPSTEGDSSSPVNKPE